MKDCATKTRKELPVLTPLGRNQLKFDTRTSEAMPNNYTPMFNVPEKI
jgi:hypothetical protein